MCTFTAYKITRHSERSVGICLFDVSIYKIASSHTPRNDGNV
jgi:hypothetical protein